MRKAEIIISSNAPNGIWIGRSKLAVIQSARNYENGTIVNLGNLNLRVIGPVINETGCSEKFIVMQESFESRIVFYFFALFFPFYFQICKIEGKLRNFAEGEKFPAKSLSTVLHRSIIRPVFYE